MSNQGPGPASIVPRPVIIPQIQMVGNELLLSFMFKLAGHSTDELSDSLISEVFVLLLVLLFKRHISLV